MGAPAPGQVPVGALLGLQRSAGNAAVIQMLRGRPIGAAPAAPAPPTARQEEAAESTEPEPAPESLVGEVAALEEGEVPTRAEKAEKRAERDLPPDAEEPVETGGGPFPIAEPAPATGEFRDAGRDGSVPFGDAPDEGFDPSDPEGDLRPHAFTPGGRTGTNAWAGGGGAGPKGNQPAGSIQEKVDPDYDSYWGGFRTNADAWVIEGTGTVNVKRDYVSSNSGDQGNGWYVTDKAAAALEKHEQRHVTQTRSVYIDKIQPLLDRILNSYGFGKGKVYKSSDAKVLVKRYVDWPASIRGFDEDDNAWNAPGGRVDTDDQGSANFPNQIGPGKVNGKEFPHRLKMPTEEAPPT